MAYHVVQLAHFSFASNRLTCVAVLCLLSISTVLCSTLAGATASLACGIYLGLSLADGKHASREHGSAKLALSIDRIKLHLLLLELLLPCLLFFLFPALVLAHLQGLLSKACHDLLVVHHLGAQLAPTVRVGTTVFILVVRGQRDNQRRRLLVVDLIGFEDLLEDGFEAGVSRSKGGLGWGATACLAWACIGACA